MVSRLGSSHADRDAQIAHINDTVKSALDAGQPVISARHQKKELAGISKTAGASCARRRPGPRARLHECGAFSSRATAGGLPRAGSG
jgi:DDE family transposase